MYLTVILTKEQQQNDVGFAAILMCKQKEG